MPHIKINGPDFRKLAYELLTAGHRLRFQASGESMHPSIQDGDIIEVAPQSNKLKLKCGDVLLVDTNTERLIVHRVIEIDHSRSTASYLIKADAGTFSDGWFPYENILGRVEAVERGGLRIVLTSLGQSWKTQAWVMISPWASWFSWLPSGIRQHVRDWLLVN